jgi:ferredoxin
VIEAVADGRRAARAIDSYLTGRSDEPPAYRVRVFDIFGYDHPFARGDYDRVPRMPLPLIPVERRVPGREVERVMGEADARAEGERCLHCWVNTIFDSSRIAGSECIQCGGCVDVCPEQCIDLLALARIDSPARAAAPLRLPNGAALEFLDGRSAGAALIKDETACIRCGLCARRCPAGTITMQAFYAEDEAARMQRADTTL